MQKYRHLPVVDKPVDKEFFMNNLVRDMQTCHKDSSSAKPLSVDGKQFLSIVTLYRLALWLSSTVFFFVLLGFNFFRKFVVA